MSAFYEFKRGGSIAGPDTGATVNTITLDLNEIDGGKFIGVPQSGSFYSKTCIFAEIFLMMRGSTTATGVYIRRATFLANNGTPGSGLEGNLLLSSQEDCNVGALSGGGGPNNGPVTGVGTVNVPAVPGVRSLEDNANTVPRISWPFTSCVFRVENPGSGVRTIAVDFTIDAGAGTAANISDVFWEFKLKSFVTGQ